MKPKFELSIRSLAVVNELPGTWSEAECRALLNELEFGDTADIPPDQLLDYAIMALQDLEDDKAAGVLLDYIFSDALSAGKKQNLADQMTDERPWEEYPDLSCHERIFNAQFLLNQAYPDAQRPEINKILAVLSNLNQAAESYLSKQNPNVLDQNIPEALIIRCLAAALPDNSILNRLFEDQIKGEMPFTEAAHILWHVYAKKLPGESGRPCRYELTLYAPTRWTGSLEKDTLVECEPFVRDLEVADE